MDYTIEQFRDEMDDALAQYAVRLSGATDAYISRMKELMAKSRGLDVERVLGIVDGARIRANALKQRMGS